MRFELTCYESGSVSGVGVVPLVGLRPPCPYGWLTRLAETLLKRNLLGVAFAIVGVVVALMYSREKAGNPLF